MKHYLIWDFDGTLGYRDGGWSGTLKEILDEKYADVSIKKDELKNSIKGNFYWGNPDILHKNITTTEQWWHNLSPIFEVAFRDVAGLDSSKAKEFSKLVKEKYLDKDKWHLFEDSKETLEKFSKEGWTHILLSNHVPELKEVLDFLGISHFFERIYNSAETGVEKPNYKAYLQVLTDIAGHGKVWMIGDNIDADINGAQNVGIQSVLVRNKNDQAKRFCESLRELGLFVK